MQTQRCGVEVHWTEGWADSPSGERVKLQRPTSAVCLSCPISRASSLSLECCPGDICVVDPGSQCHVNLQLQRTITYGPSGRKVSCEVPLVIGGLLAAYSSRRRRLSVHCIRCLPEWAIAMAGSTRYGTTPASCSGSYS